MELNICVAVLEVFSYAAQNVEKNISVMHLTIVFSPVTAVKILINALLAIHEWNQFGKTNLNQGGNHSLKL